MTTLDIAYLADYPDAVPVLATWFRREWPAYYAGRPEAEGVADFMACLHRDQLPMALLAFQGSVLCGTATLRADSISTHPHLAPWLAAFYVPPPLRGQGIGRRLIGAVEDEARRLGFSMLYAGSSTAVSLFERAGWEAFERSPYHGAEITLLRRALDG